MPDLDPAHVEAAVVTVHLHPPCPNCGAQRATIDGGDVEHLIRPQDLSADLLACPSLLAETSG